MGNATNAPKFYDVPAGTKPATCTGKQKGGVCQATIYWITSRKGKPLPVDCDVEGGCTPSIAGPDQYAMPGVDADEVRDGRGVSHFQTCRDVSRFSR